MALRPSASAVPTRGFVSPEGTLIRPTASRRQPLSGPCTAPQPSMPIGRFCTPQPKITKQLAGAPNEPWSRTRTTITPRDHRSGSAPVAEDSHLAPAPAARLQIAGDPEPQSWVQGHSDVLRDHRAEGVGFEPTRKLAPPSGFQDPSCNLPDLHRCASQGQSGRVFGTTWRASDHWA